MGLPVVELGSHAEQALPRYAVWAAIGGSDEAPLPEAQRHVERAIGKDEAVARDAGDIMDLAVRAALVADGAALGKRMQNALFAFRYVQGFVSEFAKQHKTRPGVARGPVGAQAFPGSGTSGFPHSPA
jgi:hypothetical protein